MYLCIYLSIYLSIGLSIYLQVWKRSYSVRPPHLFKLTTSKRQHFCETSLKNGKLSAELMASYQCVLPFFYSICLKCSACHKKVMPGHTKRCTCHTKSSSQNCRSDAPKCSFWGNQRPDLLTSLMNMSLLLRLPREMQKTLTSCSLLTRCTSPCACHTKRHLNVQRCPEPVIFLTLKMCFAPQRRALFRHRNFQKWSEHEVFCAFWLLNVLRATTACNFSSLIWPDGSAPAALASLLFDPPEPQIIEKTQWFATFLSFRAPASSFFWLLLFSDLLSSALLFSDSSHLCCSICPYCRKFDF